MKKRLLIITVAILGAAALLIFFPFLRRFFPTAGRGVVEVISLPGAREIDLAGVVPARAGVFLRARSAAANWDKLAGGRFFRELTASAFWREGGGEEKLAAARRGWVDETGFEIDRSRIMAVAGRDIALAVISAQGVSPDGVIVLARLGTRARLTEILLRLADALKDRRERMLREEDYRGEKIITVSTTDAFPLAVAYTVIDGCLAAAFSAFPPRPLLEEVIDLARGEGDSLAAFPEFSAAIDGGDFAADSVLEGYLNPGRFSGRMGRRLDPGPLAEAVLWGEEVVKTLVFCRTIGGRVGYREGIHTRLRLALEDGAVAEADPPALDLSGRRVRLPAGEMLWGFFTLDPVRVGEMLSGLGGALGLGGEGPGSSAWENWEAAAGISLRRDLLPVLGRRFGLVLGGVTGEEFIPIPRVALAGRVGDRERAALLLDKLAAGAALSSGLRPVREGYSGAELTYFPGLWFVEPSWSLAGEELVIAGSREMLRTIVDLRGEEKSGIEADPVFSRVSSGFPADPEVLIHLDGEILLRSLAAAGDWYFAYQRLAPEQPLLPESLWRKTIIPLLDLFRGVRAAGFAVWREKNVVKNDGFVYIPEH